MAQNAQFANLNINLFPGDTPPYASRLGLCSSPVTIELDISVSENDIYVTIELGIFVLENIHLAHPKDRPGGDGGYTPTDLKRKIKATLKCIAKIHALQCKANFINTYF